MEKFFNTAGLCTPEKHYMVDPLRRLAEIEELIEKELYFSIHAPRQTGKTTYLHALAKKLNREGKYISIVVSFESAGYSSITIEKANQLLNYSIFQASRKQLAEKYRPLNPKEKNYLNISDYLSEWCGTIKKPLILLIDEIDALVGDLLISVLRQLRDGYQSRPQAFPSSVALVGLRDVRDYRAKIRPQQESLGAISPFNIKAKSVFLNNFTKDEVFDLLEQHEKATKQMFPPETKEEIFNLSNGQPWLVNAIANQIVSEILNNDWSKKIAMDIVNEAKLQLILRRDTHLDSLADKLKEKRVKGVVQAIINGDTVQFDILEDDIVYLRDLGLVSQTSPLEFANKIYAEIIPRIMASPIEVLIPKEIQSQWFVTEKNELDMDKVMEAFQEFYMENAESWLDRYTYKESAHHLLLMAFLQRLVNAGGEIIREMAAGNRRLDLLVRFHKQRIAMELKIWRGERSIEKAKKQLTAYLDRLGLNEGYLVIFDPRNKDWEEKLYRKEITFNSKQIIMIGV